MSNLTIFHPGGGGHKNLLLDLIMVKNSPAQNSNLTKMSCPNALSCRTLFLWKSMVDLNKTWSGTHLTDSFRWRLPGSCSSGWLWGAWGRDMRNITTGDSPHSHMITGKWFLHIFVPQLDIQDILLVSYRWSSQPVWSAGIGYLDAHLRYTVQT